MPDWKKEDRRQGKKTTQVYVNSATRTVLILCCRKMQQDDCVAPILCYPKLGENLISVIQPQGQCRQIASLQTANFLEPNDKLGWFAGPKMINRVWGRRKKRGSGRSLRGRVARPLGQGGDGRGGWFTDQHARSQCAHTSVSCRQPAKMRHIKVRNAVFKH